MAKRPFGQSNIDGQERRQGTPAKRQKKDEHSAWKGHVPQSIHTARQLQGLFAEYSNVAKLQEGIQSFKKFLAECRDLQYTLHINEEPQLVVLQEYLEAQLSREGDETCGDLMQAWSFAAQSNNFQLLSSIPTALHILLRTISLFPTWKKHGVALAKTVLQPAYLKIVYRSLGGNKDSITSPCLRLLTEINKFDEGSLCPLLHQAVDFTVKDLGRNLEAKKIDKAEPAIEDPERPGVRTVFVRFILSFFQYAPAKVKTDIMGLRIFTTPLFKYTRQDSALAIKEMLTTFSKHVMGDQNIPRSAKTNYFNDWSLSRIGELCYREDIVDPQDPDTTVADVAWKFLTEIGTSKGNGVCFQDNGWYTGTKLDGGAEGKGKGVNNRILLGLLKSLRPYSNTYHLRLLVAILQASPELVAPYFNDSTAFTFDPKLTATWIGLSSVFLEAIQIKVPEWFGYPVGTISKLRENDMAVDVPSTPPSVKTMIENILPQQLTKAVLTKCLTYNNYLVKFLSIRILNAAFSKLSTVLEMLDELSSELVDVSSWSKAAYDLADEFSKRVPDISTIIATFNQTPENGALQKEAITRLLLNYYELLPTVVASHKFDFSTAFAKVLARIDGSEGFEALEVANSLRLAKVLPETKWWNKSANAKHSPAVGLMKAYIEQGASHHEGETRASRNQLYMLVEKIVDDSPLFAKKSLRGIHPLEALLESLEYTKSRPGWERTLEFLDNASGRLVQGPYKFYDIIGGLCQIPHVKNLDHGEISPLLAALFHQFKFVDAKKDAEGSKALCSWLLRLSNNFAVLGEIPTFKWRKGDIDLLECELGNAGEMLQQFVEGLSSWRQLLDKLDIEISYDPKVLEAIRSSKKRQVTSGIEEQEIETIFDSMDMTVEAEDIQEAYDEYLNDLGLDLESGTVKGGKAALDGILQKLVYDLTVKLSEIKLEKLSLKLCVKLGDYLEKGGIDLMDHANSDAVNSLLEAAFEKLENQEVVGLAAAIVGNTEDIKSLEHSKLLQLVLSRPNSLSSRDLTLTIPALEARSQSCLSFIILKLFSASKSTHCNFTTLDGVLALYRGSNSAPDIVLLEILMTIEGYLSRSIMDRVISVKASDGVFQKHPIERDGKGRLTISINPKLLQQSITRFTPRKLRFEYNDKENLTEFLGKCQKSFDGGEERGSTYDVTFISAVVMHGLSTEKDDQKLELKEVIDNHALSFIILGLSSENAEDRAMAEAVLTNVVGKLESVQGWWGYRERVEVLHFLCKVLASLRLPSVSSDSEESDEDDEDEDEAKSIKNSPIPTITAVFLAQALIIISTPSHTLYEKLMRWLQSRAAINLDEVPLLREFLRTESEAYWKEITWMLEILADGMKSNHDVEVCRKRGVFEEILNIYGSVDGNSTSGGSIRGRQSKEDVVRKKIIEILWNAAGVSGGATTLITRTGVLSWIKMMISTHAGDAEAAEESRVILKRLAARLWEACDQEYVKEWSKGSIGRVLEGMVKLGIAK